MANIHRVFKYVATVVCANIIVFMMTGQREEDQWTKGLCVIEETIVTPAGGVFFPCGDQCCPTTQEATGTRHPQIYEVRYIACNPQKKDACDQGHNYFHACGKEASQTAAMSKYPIGHPLPCNVAPDGDTVSLELVGQHDPFMFRLMAFINIIMAAAAAYVMNTPHKNRRTSPQEPHDE